jgi:hypothetical protein
MTKEELLEKLKAVAESPFDFEAKSRVQAILDEEAFGHLPGEVTENAKRAFFEMSEARARYNQISACMPGSVRERYEYEWRSERRKQNP